MTDVTFKHTFFFLNLLLNVHPLEKLLLITEASQEGVHSVTNLATFETSDTEPRYLCYDIQAVKVGIRLHVLPG